MAYRIIYHPKAEAELDKLYADIAVEAGTGIAGDFVHAVITFIEALETFPERGTGHCAGRPDSRPPDHRLSAQRQRGVLSERQ
ncbi:plasmid stabilization system protein ParE [Rhizobium leguminosarum]|uniref:Toxin ParE1/3/4 n=1 Tax=Rhizobium esperanzae TaxID=1967781 RepID=A0A7W6UPR2_9HYPH|nr:toxin ParE1/3/4 [Rhizobium esperanzae]MDH6204974.1 plasmid stabilization system protein ParE [Rhizobium leguminosarum]